MLTLQTPASLSAMAWRRALAMTAPIERDASRTLPIVIDELADRLGSVPAALSETETLDYDELTVLSRRYAGWALRHEIGKGDVVALVMPNSPHYLAVWLGLVRIGAVVALVNTSLVGGSLCHSLETVAPKHVIVGAALADALMTIWPQTRLSCDARVWVHGGSGHNLPRIEDALGEVGDIDLGGDLEPTLEDRALYIYTSGTTGLPKAAGISHLRLMQWSHWFAGMMNVDPRDRMYCCLPMYHSVGGVVATGAALVAGASVFVRERFSVSQFWDDIFERECTLFQYIGELCRYLAQAPPHPREHDHRLRLACGNGLRPEVWKTFQARFRIPQILEFYAATEGSFSLYNAEGRPGAIGRIPPFLTPGFPIALIRLDLEGDEPARATDGFCIRCAPNEIGEAIGRLTLGSTGGGRFEGYTDPEASARKVLRNVFAEGDAWYRSGDLMRRDSAGYFYFVDRVGDTFRWKGENVSAREVEEVIVGCPGVVEAVVYGVTVSGAEGRAGMAAMVTGDGFDLTELHRRLVEHLPGYARPVFLRLCNRIKMTATFKPHKQQYASEGYDPESITDQLYFDARMRGKYVVLDLLLHERLRTGKVRL